MTTRVLGFRAALSLSRAYVWRSSRERRFQFARFVLPYISVLLLVFLPRITSNDAGTNGISIMAAAGRANGIPDLYAANVGGAIQLAPMLSGLLAGIGAASVAQTFFSDQKVRGEVEVLLAARIEPRDIVSAAIIYTSILATLLWATTMLLGSIGIGIIMRVHSVGIHPDVWYIVAFVVLPLLTAVCSAVLTCALCTTCPSIALIGSGNVSGGKGLVTVAGMTPGVLAAAVYLAVPARDIGAGCLIAIGAMVVVITSACYVTVARFQAERFVGN